jgi:mono/diheme cytochrome c family protein
MARWILATVALGLTLAGCDTAPPPQGTSSAEAPGERVPYPFQLTEAQRSGRVIFEAVCWTCHGLSGRGDGPGVQAGSVSPPPNFHEEPHRSMGVDDLEGLFTQAMEGDDPSHPHMRTVARILRPETFRSALSYVPALVWPPEIPGSALVGRDRYATHCTACHGEDGQGHGTAAEVLLVPPAQFPTDTLIAAGDWNGVNRRIREGGEIHGSSMPEWGVVLSDEEIWDLVAYIASFQGADVLSEPPAGS